MTTIDQLSAVDTVSEGDQFPLWSAANGDTRRASASQISEMVLAGITEGETFATRAELVTKIATGNLIVVSGTLYAAGGLLYSGSVGSTAISDLPGLLPFGEATPGHWGATKGQTAVDESTKVQAAMTWAGANTGRLVFDGVYRADGVNGVSNLVCDGLNRTGGITSLSVLSFTGTLSGQHVINAEGVSDFSFVGMKFDNSVNTRFASGLRTISLYNCHRFLVDNCYFATGGAATAAVNCSYYRVTNCDTKIQTLYLVALVPTVQHDGVYDQWWGSHDFEIIGNTITKGNVAAKYPILITGSDAGSVNATRCYNFKVNNNRVLGFEQSGIWTMGRHGGCEDFEVTGNHIDGGSDSLGHGMHITACRRGTFSGNVISNAKWQGIRIYKEAASEIGIHSNEDLTITGNVVHNANVGVAGGTTGAAIYAQDDFKRVALTGNVVVGTTHTYPVYINGSGTAETNFSVFGGSYAVGTVAGVTFANTPSASGGMFMDDTGNMSVVSPELRVKGFTTETVAGRIGHGRTGDGNSTLALVGDATNTSGGTFVTRYGGVNGAGEIRHKGTGVFQTVIEDAAPWTLTQNSTETLRATSARDVGIGASVPSTKLDVNGPIRSRAVTVATLPAAGTVGSGTRTMVTDANATTFNSVVAAGGANIVPVFSDGTNWRIG